MVLHLYYILFVSKNYEKIKISKNIFLASMPTDVGMYLDVCIRIKLKKPYQCYTRNEMSGYVYYNIFKYDEADFMNMKIEIIN